MNNEFKINGNVLEITLPEEVHIDKVIVNRQIFSQRMQVCESCKYHGLEGHEEPCVSCEVGNSNYVPSVEQEERMEERTETHACDCISRQAAIDAINAYLGLSAVSRTIQNMTSIQEILEKLPSAEPERKKGKWIKNPEYIGDEISGFIDNHFSCSKCKKEAEINSWGFYTLSDFCPNCGADMRGEQE